MASSGIATAIADPDMAICIRCYNSKPQPEFVDCYPGQRFALCIACREKEIAKAKDNKGIVQNVIKAAISTGQSKTGQSKIESPHVSELAEGIIKQFGGLEQFCREWHYQISVAMKDKPGTKTVLDSFKVISMVINQSTAHRQSAPDMEELSDAELAATVMTLMEQQNVIEGQFEVQDDGSKVSTTG